MSPTDFNNDGMKRGQSRYGSVKLQNWDESKIKRDNDGKFGSGGGGGGGEKAKPIKKQGNSDTAKMTAGELQKEHEKLSKKSSVLIDKLIEAGFGTLKPSDMRAQKADNPLFEQYIAVSDRQSELQAEAEARGGPGFTVSRLDKSFKPRKRKEEE